MYIYIRVVINIVHYAYPDDNVITHTGINKVVLIDCYINQVYILVFFCIFILLYFL